jgi:general secretion pathway protein B
MDDAELERETEEELLADARTLERSIPPLTVPRAGRNGIPYLRDLPLSFQERIPPLKISMFAYSRNPAERFVIIDMKKHRVGDQIPGGALLMEIQAENLLLELEGQKFLLPRF